MGDLAPRERTEREALAIHDEMDLFLKEHGIKGGGFHDSHARSVVVSFVIGKLAQLEIKCAMMMEAMG